MSVGAPQSGGRGESAQGPRARSAPHRVPGGTGRRRQKRRRPVRRSSARACRVSVKRAAQRCAASARACPERAPSRKPAAPRAATRLQVQPRQRLPPPPGGSRAVLDTGSHAAVRTNAARRRPKPRPRALALAQRAHTARIRLDGAGCSSRSGQFCSIMKALMIAMMPMTTSGMGRKSARCQRGAEGGADGRPREGRTRASRPL